MMLLATGWGLAAATLGYLGTAGYLAAYAWLSLPLRTPRRPYFLTNLIAGLTVAMSSVYYETWPSVGLNLTWAAISLHGWFGRPGSTRRRAPAWALPVVVAASLVAAVAALLPGEGVRLAAELLGWGAWLTFCLSYFLFSTGRLTPRAFHAAQGFAAVAMLPVAIVDGNWPIVVLESCWAVFSGIGFVRGEVATLERAEPAD